LFYVVKNLLNLTLPGERSIINQSNKYHTILARSNFKTYKPRFSPPHDEVLATRLF